MSCIPRILCDVIPTASPTRSPWPPPSSRCSQGGRSWRPPWARFDKTLLADSLLTVLSLTEQQCKDAELVRQHDVGEELEQKQIPDIEVLPWKIGVATRHSAKRERGRQSRAMGCVYTSFRPR